MSKMEEERNCCECECLETLSNKINGGMSRFFGKLGLLIGRYPIIVMLICAAVAAVFIPGMVLYFETENDVEDLWVPANSQAVKDSKWVSEQFPTSIRVETVFVVASGGNVLTTEGIQQLLQLDEAIKALTTTNSTWDSICARLGPYCWAKGLLEMWSYNSTVINSLTLNDIQDAINQTTVSPVFLSAYSASQYLSIPVVRDNTGKITGAKAAQLQYVIKQDPDVESADKDELAMEWEQKFIDLLRVAADDYSTIDTIYFNAFRGFGDAASENIAGDLILLFIGYGVIITFVSVVLGSFSLVHHRVYVALGGVACVGLAIVVSYGLCLYIGLLYGPVHSILPFLMIGIGVDDMFVIVQALEQLSDEDKTLPVPERMAATMSHAGVSITVTSLTDIVAFGVGATTVLPALQSFCLYASIGILFIYLFQATFFVACIVFDERRKDSSRDACCFCITHEDYEMKKCARVNLTQMVFDKYYGPMLTMLPVKIAVMVVTVAVAAAMAYGLSQLDQFFDPIWFLPSDSDSAQFADAADVYFPGDGITTAVYLGDIDYYTDKYELEALYEGMANEQYTYTGTVDSFVHSFWAWLNATSATHTGMLDDDDNYPNSEANYYSLLETYLAGAGSRFNKDIIGFNSTTNEILASKITMKHINLEGSSEQIAAMDGLRDVAKSIGYSENECFAYSREYLNFETNKIIQVELYRNLGVAFACVLVMTFILIASPLVCLYVSLCVVLVLLDVAGTMYYWGLTIDTVTSVILILAIGLAVDYSAHIGESFMMVVGTRDERIIATMSSIGPAVFYGGFSTFLAFILLAASKSYIFTTFFKVFFCVVLYGMFHGLVFLPVVLTWVGPKPYLSAQHGHGHGAAPPKVDAEHEKISMENGATTPKNGGPGNRNGANPNGLDNAAVVLERKQKSGESPGAHGEEPPAETAPLAVDGPPHV